MEALERVSVSTGDLMKLCAADGMYYCHKWFPQAFRQTSPGFHRHMWETLENPSNRHVAFKVFRGGAKTTITRAYVSSRVAYAISHTIMVVGESQDQAIKTTRWLKKQVLNNTAWAQFYKLSRGDKWTDEWLEIKNGHSGTTISIVAVGITGQTRGLNIDDFRPDFIMVDDPCDEENTATPEQREKISKLFYGALEKSLAPPTEAPLATMALLQTPLARGDLIEDCMEDPSWASFEYSCFDVEGKSAWEARFTTEFLVAEKQKHIDKNKLPLWLREMEVKVVAEATSAFLYTWLRYWEPYELPENTPCFMFIDPVPPPSDQQTATGLRDKDEEAMAVVTFYRGKFYLLDYRHNKGHDPDWTVMQFWDLIDNYPIQKVRIEGVAYQRTLKWILEKSMMARRRWVQVDIAKDDKRKKIYRITDNLNGVCSSGTFYVNRGLHHVFIEQFTAYPNIAHDDVLEAVAGATQLAQEAAIFYEGEYETIDDDPEGDSHGGYIGGAAP